MPTPRGIRNNNPLNIRHSRDRFQGDVVPSRDGAFKQFSSLAHGRNTVEKIIRAWAPPTENNTEGYIAHVVQRSGVGRNKVLTAESGGDYRKIVAAMSHCENGIPANMAEVEAGFRMQCRIKN